MIFISDFLLLTLVSLQAPSVSPPEKQSAAGVASLAPIIVALISAAVSLFSVWWARRNQSFLQREQARLSQQNQEKLAELQSTLALQTQTEIEKAKSQLGEQGKERDARRDYEYDARKRLYAEVEPIRFNLFEALEEAHYRVRSLARTARSGNLGTGADSWVTGPGYYLRSTIYKLLSPVAHFRLLQRRMTFIDFSLDRDIALQYMLMKLYVRAFTDDFLIANLAPVLPYQPNAEKAGALALKQPAVFSRQALVLGDLECISDLLTVKEDGEARVLQFGEFERLFAEDELDENLQEVLNLFTFFSPELKPVLARLLIIEAYFAQLILSTYKSNSDPSELPARLEELLTDPELQRELSWANGPTDFSFVRSYWKPRIEHIEITAPASTVAR